MFPMSTDINVCFKLCVFEHPYKLVFILHQYECNASLRRRVPLMGRVIMLRTLFWIFKTVICCPRVFLGLVGVDSQHSISFSRSSVFLSRSKICKNISTSEAKQAKCPYLWSRRKNSRIIWKVINKHNYKASYTIKQNTSLISTNQQNGISMTKRGCPQSYHSSQQLNIFQE